MYPDPMRGFWSTGYGKVVGVFLVACIPTAVVLFFVFLDRLLT